MKGVKRTAGWLDHQDVCLKLKISTVSYTHLHLYPYDKVTVVGTDRQLESFRTSMEQKKVERNGNGTCSQDETEIGQFPVEGGSPLIGKTIREADISDSIIIGIERSTVNIMNPDPDTIFKENDTVWIVGKRKIIKGLNKD